MGWKGCGKPQRKRTRAGTRCVQVCSGGRIRYLPNEKCGMNPAGWVPCGCGK